jgi:hypothetical protein
MMVKFISNRKGHLAEKGPLVFLLYSPYILIYVISCSM